MKTHKRVTRSGYLHRQLPFVAHLIEVLSVLIVFTVGQNLWAVMVGASPDVTAPSVPTGIAMTGRTPTSIDLSWTASTDDVAVTGYKIFRGGSQVGTSNTNSYTDSNLTPNSSYNYTVSAYDAAANQSAQSSPPTNVSTLADTTPPSIPSNIHQTGQTTSTISIAWNASSDNVGVTSYEIYRNGALVRAQSGTTLTDTGLAVYTSYNYTIDARDAAGNTSNISPAFYASTAQDVTPPSVPDNIHTNAQTVNSVTLGWDNSTDNVGVTGYHVYRNGALVGSPGGNTFTDTGLSVASSYTYTITSFDAAGNTSAASAAYVTSSSSDTTAPSTPLNVHTTSVLDTSISLAWNNSTDDVGVAGYKIYRNSVLIGTSNTNSFPDSGLNPDTNYGYSIVAYDAANNTSPGSLTLSVTTAHDTTPPTVPANLRSPSQTDTTISLAWDASTDNNTVNGYDLYRNNVLITSTSGTTFTDTGRAVNTSYTYRVLARDLTGNSSAQSGAFSVSTLSDMVAPTAANNLVTTGKTTTTVDLAWDAGTDDVAVAGYKIYRDGTYVTTSASLSYSVTGLHYNQTYHFTVKTVDASGNEAVASNDLPVTTLPDTTSPTVALTAPAAGNQQLTFQISANAGDDLDLARVEFYADSTKIATITTAPFAFNWDSYAVHNGSRTITAKAFDVTGNFSSSAVVVNITNPPPVIVGDINTDHKVNIFDLSILLSHWNKPGSGDFNNNGKVDIFDLSVLLAHFGQDNTGYN